MRSTNCYMPTWQGEKLVKRGSYCNWESVLAHAHHMYDVDKSLEREELDRVMEYLVNIMGTLPDHSEYHFSFLDHFKGNLSVDQYHNACCKTTEEVTAVKINPTGDVFDIIMDPHVGKFDFDNYITRPYMLHGPEHKIAQFQSTRKAKIPKDRELTVFYWPFKNGLPLNTIASNIFKMQIYGDVLLVQQTKESAFRPRERYTNFTKQQFDELFTKKKRKTVEANALTPTEFQAVKSQMQSSLDGCEVQISSSAQIPQDLARGAAMPSPSGKELKEVAEFLGCVPPEKKQKLEDRMTAPMVEVAA